MLWENNITAPVKVSEIIAVYGDRIPVGTTVTTPEFIDIIKGTKRPKGSRKKKLFLHAVRKQGGRWTRKSYDHYKNERK